MPLTNVGTLVGELGMDTSKFTKGMDKAGGKIDTSFKNWERRTRVVGDRLGALGKTLSLRLTAPILALGAAGLGLAFKMGQAADKLLDLRSAFGVSLDFLQEMKFAASQAGVPFDVLTQAFNQLLQRLRGVETVEDVPDIFRELGVLVFDMEGNMRPLSDIFLDVVDKLSQIENPAERARVGTELFGEQWGAIAPLVEGGRKALEELGTEAHDLGLILTEEEIVAMNETRKEMEKFKLIAETLAFKTMNVLIERFKELPDAMKLAAAGFIGLAVAAAPLLLILSAIAAAVAVITATVAITTVLIVLALGSLIVLVVLFWEEIKALWDLEVGLFLEGMVHWWGELVKIWEFGIATVKLLWSLFWEGITSIIDTKVQEVTAIIEVLGSVFTSVFDAIAGVVTRVGDIISRTVDSIVSAVGRALAAIRNLPGGSFIPGFATGVRNFSGGMAMVGERGPELVHLPRGSSVIPNGAGAAASLSGGGGGPTFDLRGANIFDADGIERLIGKVGGQVIRHGGWPTLVRTGR